jgi:predicted membrane-bound mannosyltransferase
VKEVVADEKWEDERGTVNVAPSESELVTIALLMRLYDLNLALLNHFDSDLADEIYELHEKGGHKNPQLFIPAPVEREEDETNQS